MQKLGNIKLLLENDKYALQFKYSYPRKIDFFELTLMEIIKRKNNFLEQTIADILLLMEIPAEFNFIFSNKIKELISSNPEIINFDGTEADDFLSCRVSKFSLTKMGNEVFASREIHEDPKSISAEYLYESTSKMLIKPPEKHPGEDDCIVLYMRNLNPSDVNEKFHEIISKNPRKYIGDINAEIKIFDVEAIHAGTATLHDNITVSIENGKLIFSNNSKEVLSAFFNLHEQEKQRLKTNQIFNYLDCSHVQINFEKAKIAVKRQQPIQMNVVFGDTNIIKEAVKAEKEFSIPSEEMDKLRAEYNFCFAGITNKGVPLIYKYCEMREAGFTIPLEEIDNSEQNYISILKAVYNRCIRETEFIFLAIPEKQKVVFINNLIENTDKYNNMLSLARQILKYTKNDKVFHDLINKKIIKLLNSFISEKDLDINEVVNTVNEFNLHKETVIKMFKEKSLKTDSIINALLAMDEATTIRVYELKKMYNALLKDKKLSEITHNTNLYASFLNYEKQYKKLETIGLISYYEYKTPKDWDAFMKEVYILKSQFERLKRHMDNDIMKQASDFFMKIQDDYDMYSQVDEKIIKQIIGKGLENEIAGNKYDTVMLASAIRNKYEEYLRSEEKNNDPAADGKRKGIKLIKFTVDKKLLNDTHKHWTNICTLVHKATAQEHPLWKGNDKDRQIALKNALNFFNKNFNNLGGKDEPFNKSAV